MPPHRVAVTYANDQWNDGAGAQLHRIYGIYALSRFLRLPYVHSPLSKVGYQGLKALEANAGSGDLVDSLNRLFAIASDIPLPEPRHEVVLPAPQLGFERALEALSLRMGRPVLGRIVLPFPVTDRFSWCFEACKAISPFRAEEKGGPLRVALHVRRGELFVVDSDRMLPNAFYIGAAQRIARVLEKLGRDYRIELHTEVASKDFVVHPNHHGIEGRIAEPVAVGPALNALGDFEVLPNLLGCINDPMIDCLRKLATADILVMSRSSFSYVAAILNRTGTILYHPFWHPALPSWLTAAPDGSFDEAALLARLAH